MYLLRSPGGNFNGAGPGRTAHQDQSAAELAETHFAARLAGEREVRSEMPDHAGLETQRHLQPDGQLPPESDFPFEG
jgi:hypothetical protein